MDENDPGILEITRIYKFCFFEHREIPNLGPGWENGSEGKFWGLGASRVKLWLINALLGYFQLFWGLRCIWKKWDKMVSSG